QDGVRAVNGSVIAPIGWHTFDQTGRTIVAAMPTLWLIGAWDRFERGRSWIESRLNFDSNPTIHWNGKKLFEEYYASMLSCFFLTGDVFFRHMSVQLSKVITNRTSVRIKDNYALILEKSNRFVRLTTPDYKDEYFTELM